MTRTVVAPSAEVDLSGCDREPIHVPGSIQPHGLLLAMAGPRGVVVQASRNVRDALGLDAEDVLGRSLEGLLGRPQARAIREAIAAAQLERNPSYVGTVEIGPEGHRRPYHAIAHQIDGVLILELEPTDSGRAASFRDLDPLIRAFLTSLEGADSVADLGRLGAAEVRRITGFDRALIYRFDEDGHGTVIAEDRNDALPAYLGHRFPASDVPRQARELYRINRLRMIPDVGYEPAPLVPGRNPATGGPLDLTYAALRSVSPVHVAYMRNMGTASSMSVSILREGELWGLISCHNRTPRSIPFEVRTACDILGRVLALQMSAKERHADDDHRMRLQALQARLLVAMADRDDFAAGLADRPDELLELASAQGAAVVRDGRCTLVGVAPEAPAVLAIARWLADQARGDVYQTESLPSDFSEADPGLSCGLLAASISRVHRDFVLWFRPEVVRTVQWGGDPGKPTATFQGGGTRLHPRASFETWKQTVRLRSLPWRPIEVAAAASLRNAIVDIVLRRAEELAQLNADLQRTNRELEAFSYSVSHDLRAPFRHIVGYSELLMEEPGLGEEARRFVATIIESAQYAGTLVDNLLAFSQMGRSSLRPERVDMNRLVADVREDVASEASGRSIRWEVGDLPPAHCDPAMMRLALRNLLSNAVKYTRTRAEATIRVEGEDAGTETVYSVRDDGVGFDMRYVDKLFGVFQRLHRMEDFEGTGIGLANVRRIVERHGGRVRAEGAPDAGATFTFALPKAPDPGSP